jgi:thioredoxin-like negative regulator of GroEL
LPQQTPLTHTTFWDFVHSHEFALIHFWASWNGHDVQTRKFLDDQIPSDVEPRVALATLDIDPREHREICTQHKVLNVPFLALYRDGALISTSTGLAAGETLVQYLKQLVVEPD